MSIAQNTTIMDTMTHDAISLPCPAGCECDKHNKNGRVGKFPIYCLHCGEVTFKPKFCGRECSNRYKWLTGGVVDAETVCLQHQDR